MKEGRIQFRVARPPAEVFAYVSDLERAPEWVPDLVSVEKTTPGDVGVGTRYSEVVHIGKHRTTAELEVTEYEPHTSFAHRGKGGPSTFSGRFTFQADGDGTLVTHDYAFQLSGFMKFLGPAINGWMKKNVQVGIDTLKRTLEGAG